MSTTVDPERPPTPRAKREPLNQAASMALAVLLIKEKDRVAAEAMTPKLFAEFATEKLGRKVSEDHVRLAAEAAEFTFGPPPSATDAAYAALAARVAALEKRIQSLENEVSQLYEPGDGNEDPFAPKPAS